jgi:hypothetical protein
MRIILVHIHRVFFERKWLCLQPLAQSSYYAAPVAPAGYQAQYAAAAVPPVAPVYTPAASISGSQAHQDALASVKVGNAAEKQSI